MGEGVVGIQILFQKRECFIVLKPNGLVEVECWPLWKNHCLLQLKKTNSTILLEICYGQGSVILRIGPT